MRIRWAGSAMASTSPIIRALGKNEVLTVSATVVS